LQTIIINFATDTHSQLQHSSMINEQIIKAVATGLPVDLHI